MVLTGVDNVVGRNMKNMIADMDKRQLKKATFWISGVVLRLEGVNLRPVILAPVIYPRDFGP